MRATQTLRKRSFLEPESRKEYVVDWVRARLDLRPRVAVITWQLLASITIVQALLLGLNVAIPGIGDRLEELYLLVATLSVFLTPLVLPLALVITVGTFRSKDDSSIWSSSPMFHLGVLWTVTSLILIGWFLNWRFLSDLPRTMY